MDTKSLERFATWARRELIKAVDAQATAVLAVGSVARSERSEVVKKLEAEIGRHGRQNIVDKVAYTWFNRIIALRFMDARGYTDVAVVSPARGQAHGQPEILSDAKRGNLDTDVVANTRTANAIIGLLDGTRRSTDAEGEAYALLLTEYCRYWHKPMPFMFEREGDYTELLVPANLLAGGAILDRVREVLTADVCADVEVIGWLYQFYISERKDEVFAGFRKNKKAGADEIPAATQLFTPHWIVRYLVENSLGRLWMLNRPTSRLVDQMDYYFIPADDEPDFLKISKPEELTVYDPACGSGHMLTYAFDLLYAIYEEEGYAPSDIPGLILTHNLHGAEIDPRAGSLAAFALTMKARAKQRTFFNRQDEPKICVIEPISFISDELDFLVASGGARLDEETFWNQFEHALTFGSLVQPAPDLTARLARHLATLDGGGDMLKADVIERAGRVVTQAEYLASRFAVTIANPPYMGSRNMSQDLRDLAEAAYPTSKADLYSMFMAKALQQGRPGGYVAMVTMQNWMYLASHAALRKELFASASIISMAHLGSRAFDTISGEVVATTAFVLCNSRSSVAGEYFRLTDLASAQKATELIRLARGEDLGRRFLATSADFELVPDSPVAYDFSDDVRDLYKSNRSLGERVSLKQGMATTDNARFVRLWHEVSISKICRGATSASEVEERKGSWVPYNKGGTPNSWYGNQDFVVLWKNGGAELATVRPRSVLENRFFFQPSVSWSNIGTAGAKFRYYPEGFVFDVAGMSAFPSDATEQLYLLGYLNSSIARSLLQTLAPTVNYQIGDIAKLPYVGNGPVQVLDLVRNLIDLRSEAWRLGETSWDFGGPGKASSQVRLAEVFEGIRNSRAELEANIAGLSQQNDNAWGEALGIDPGEEVSGEAASMAGNEDLSNDLVSYAVGCMLGRYSLDKPGLVLADEGAALQDYLAQVPTPSFMPDADNVIPFVDDGWFEDDIVERFRQFLRAAFGAEYFEENLRFVEESLGVKTLRDYFITKSGVSKFYADHVQRYKKRPIYWMFSSSKGSFNALIYMHRYTPSTVSTVLNEYLREYRAKLEVALANAEQAAAGGGSAKDQKEADRLRKVLVELAEYEHDVLYPLATQQIVIDLDGGVKANYSKFYPALKSIAGLEAAE